MKPDNVSKEFAGLVGDVWHEWIDTRFYNNPTGPNGLYRYEHGCACGSWVWSNRKHYPTQLCTPNRTYTIELIKARIQARGDWDGFVEWNFNETYATAITPWAAAFEEPSIKMRAVSDILTTPALLMQAYIAYRRQV